MARARNIKPGLFTNDVLAENDPLGRLLFIGLWTLADFKGELEWRTKRIKAQLLPYDDCDIEALAINLDKSGFIRFYSDGKNMYVKVLNFAEHQNPHKNEKAKGSDVPAYSDEYRQVVDLQGFTINRDKSGLIRNDSASDPADSLFLIPDSLNPIKDIPLSDSPDEKPVCKPKKTKRRCRLPKDFVLTEDRQNRAWNYWLEKNRPDLNVRDAFLKFIDYHTSKGTTMADWDSAWNTWYANQVEFVKPPTGPSLANPLGVNNNRQQVRAALRDVGNTDWDTQPINERRN